jgi:hypothetical protein
VKVNILAPKIGFDSSQGTRNFLSVVRVLGYRSGGPGSIPGTTEKKSSRSGTGSTQPLSTTEELLDRKVAAPV